MSHQADSLAFSPFMFGELFVVGAARMQQQIAEGMLAAFDALADAMSDSLRASAELAHEIGNARTPADAMAASVAWFQGRAEKSMSWFHAVAARTPSAKAPALRSPEPQAAPAPVPRAPVLPQAETRLATKPPAGSKLGRGTPIIVNRLPKKPARSATK